jgi:NADH-quinone oxidoreductase subunit C
MSPPIENLQRRFAERFPANEPDTPSPEADAVTEENQEAQPEAVSPEPCRRTEHAKVGYDLDLTVEPQDVLEAAGIIDMEGFAIDMITAVDWPDENQFELIYDFLHFLNPARVVVRTRIPRDRPLIPSLSAIFPGANWHERETAEFFGIEFPGHPNPIHLLLPEDFNGYPLRKDFKPEPELEPS